VRNASAGPLSFCALIHAKSPAHALALLRKNLPAEIDVPVDALSSDVAYIAVFVDPSAITTDDISDVETT
jgi:hypothetical protein